MKKKKGIIALAVTLICSLLMFSGCKPHSKSAFMLDCIADSLDLNEEQENKLENIRTEIMEQVELMHADKVEMHNTLKDQIAGDAIDKDLMRELIADHRTQMDSVIDLAVERLSDFHGDLSPEQRQKLLAKLEKLEKRHKWHKK